MRTRRIIVQNYKAIIQDEWFYCCLCTRTSKYLMFLFQVSEKGSGSKHIINIC